MLRKASKTIWPLVGLAAAALSVWLLWRELNGISLSSIADKIAATPPHRWLLAIMATLVAYAALASYDRIALMHLRRIVPWRFVALSSFTTYALSHNIGASVFSGAVVRYRAYRTQGLTPAEIGVLVALCSFTFTLSSIVLMGLLLLIRPSVVDLFFDLPVWTGLAIGIGLLAFVALYAGGSLLGLKPLKLGSFHLYYPRLRVVGLQLLVGPIEIMAAAAIIYFILPAEGNPGYFLVLAAFIASFTVALVSHAPGGIGVLEFSFVTMLGHMDPADVLMALIVFRLLYLLIPLALAIIVVIAFEQRQWRLRASTQ